MKTLKVLTVVGTRPEIIRLSCVMKKLDASPAIEHVLVHTGQNYDYELNEVFFEDLGLRKPDFFLNAAGANATETAGQILIKIDPVLEQARPDALLVLGDTNSCLCAIAAKKRHIPIFHMEAGNRCFDQRVPEESNRKIVDHISDINMPYSDIAREYLLREGLPPDRIIKTGSPMYEVLHHYRSKIEASDVLERLGLVRSELGVVSSEKRVVSSESGMVSSESGVESSKSERWNEGVPEALNHSTTQPLTPHHSPSTTHPSPLTTPYFLVSAHREENIASEKNFADLVRSLNLIAETYGFPVIVSTHPRTRKMIEKKGIVFNPLIRLMKPMGLSDYLALQLHAKAVLSDSGTISEESSILNFPALNIREAHERPEAMEEASVMMVGLNPERIMQGLMQLETQSRGDRDQTANLPTCQSANLRLVADYSMPNVSDKVVRIILSYTDYVNRTVWSIQYA